MKFVLLAVFVTIGTVNALPRKVVSSADPTCPPIGDFYAPHEDCSKYYVCDNGELRVQDCPGNLFWNQELLLCDFQYNVPECVGGTRPPTDQTGVPPTLPPVTSSAPELTTEAEVPTTAEPETEGPYSTTTTTTTEKEVPTTTASPPKTTESEEGTTEEEAQPTTRDPNNPCQEDGVYTLPVETDCSAYIQCFNGLAIPMSCAEGLEFDVEIGKCNKEELVNCTAVTTEPSVTTEIVTTPSPVCHEDGIYNVAFDEEYCSALYILCANHVPVLQECAEGLLFDLVELTCLRSEDVNCTEKATAPAVTTGAPELTTSGPVLKCNEDGVYNMPIPNSDCTNYILCVNYEAVEQSCAEGTLFSETLLKCVREEEYVCPIYSSDSPTQETDSPTQATNGTTTTGPIPTTVAPGTGPTENPFPCPPEGFHYKPHYQSCSKFYMCSDGQFRGVYTCGSSYWFDSRIQGCVEPIDSDCTLEPLPTASP